jgi:hypothetical protein
MYDRMTESEDVPERSLSRKGGDGGSGGLWTGDNEACERGGWNVQSKQNERQLMRVVWWWVLYDGRSTVLNQDLQQDAFQSPMPQKCPENYWISKRKRPLSRTCALHCNLQRRLCTRMCLRTARSEPSCRCIVY